MLYNRLYLKYTINYKHYHSKGRKNLKNNFYDSTAKSFIDLVQLDLVKVEKLIADSLSGTYQEMNDQTFYLLDLSRYDVKPYKTLIILNCGLMFRSKTPSNKLLKNYLTFYEVNHEETLLLANQFDYFQKVPVIIGKKAILPSEGYSKKNVSWLVLNQIRHVDYPSGEQSIHCYGQNQLVLALPITKNQFEDQLYRAAHLVQTKILLNNSRNKQYQYLVRKPDFMPHNILSDRIDKRSYREPTLTAFEIIQSLIKSHVLKISNLCFEEGDPYHEDFKKKLDEVLKD